LTKDIYEIIQHLIALHVDMIHTNLSIYYAYSLQKRLKHEGVCYIVESIKRNIPEYRNPVDL